MPAATPTPEPSVAATDVPAPPSTAGNTAPVAATRAPVAPPTPAPTRAARPAPVTLQVTLTTASLSFEPHQVHGNFEDTVVVTLRGSDERHSFTAPIAGIDQVIERGQSTTVRFVLPLALGGEKQEGIFPFYCRFHGTPSSGMHGFLIFH